MRHRSPPPHPPCPGDRARSSAWRGAEGVDEDHRARCLAGGQVDWCASSTDAQTRQIESAIQAAVAESPARDVMKCVETRAARAPAYSATCASLRSTRWIACSWRRRAGQDEFQERQDVAPGFLGGEVRATEEVERTTSHSDASASRSGSWAPAYNLERAVHALGGAAVRVEVGPRRPRPATNSGSAAGGDSAAAAGPPLCRGSRKWRSSNA